MEDSNKKPLPKETEEDLIYASKPNEKWVTDVTQFSLLGERV